MGQFFHLKYFVIYGFSTAFSKMDGINPPPKPRCIAQIHLYSGMWKYFDVGLYEFLFKYIYIQLSLKNSSLPRKLAASFASFLFIFFWHGFFFFIFIWSVLNYVCIVIENVSRTFSKTREYRELIEKYLSFENELRFNALMYALLFAPAAIANFYFFAGIEVGNIYFIKTYTSGIWNFVILNICLFSFCHICEYIKRRREFIKIKLQ